MIPSIVMLGTQIQHINIKLIIKSIAQKVMANFGYGA